MLKGITLTSIAKKLNTKMKSNIDSFIVDNPLDVTIKPVFVTTTSSGISIKYEVLNYPTHVDYYMHKGKNSNDGFKNLSLAVKIDLTINDIESYYADMYSKYTAHVHDVLNFISDAIEFFNNNVSAEVSISTPRDHFGTYMVSENGINVDGNIIRFTDPYTNGEHTFTAPFTYTRTDVKYLIDVRSKVFRESSVFW